MTTTTVTATKPVTKQPWQFLVTIFITSFGTWFPSGFTYVALNQVEHKFIEWVTRELCGRHWWPPNATHYCDSNWTAPYDAHNGSWRVDPYVNTMWALSSSVNLLGWTLGSAFASVLITWLTLKGSFGAFIVVYTAGTVMLTVGPVFGFFELLIAGRFLVGFAGGITWVSTPMYNYEISGKETRGFSASLPALFYYLSYCCAGVVFLPDVMGESSLWFYGSLPTLFPVAILAISLPFLPHSPKYLYIKKQDKEAAANQLASIRRKSRIPSELLEMESELQKRLNNLRRKHVANFKQFLKKRSLFSTLLLCLLPRLTLDLTGSNCMDSYSTSIFTAIGLSTRAAAYATIIMWIINFLGVMLSTNVIDRFGRRPLLLLSHIIVLLSLIIFVIFGALSEELGYRWGAYVALAAIFLYWVGLSLGLSSIPYVLPSELFDQQYRQMASTIASSMESAMAILSTFLFPLIVQYLQVYVFLFFAGVTFLDLIYVFLCLPETKGKTTLQVQEMLEIKKSPMSRNLKV